MRACERVFSVGFGPGMDSMSPARSRHSASHALAWQRYFPRIFISAYLASLPSGERPGNSYYSYHQQISPTCSRPTRFQTRTLDYPISVAVNNRHRNGIQPEESPDRTVCVAVDLSAAFDTDCHNNLLSKINRSHLPPATSRWLSCYLRGRLASEV